MMFACQSAENKRFWVTSPRCRVEDTVLESVLKVVMDYQEGV